MMFNIFNASTLPSSLYSLCVSCISVWQCHKEFSSPLFQFISKLPIKDKTAPKKFKGLSQDAEQAKFAENPHVSSFNKDLLNDTTLVWSISLDSTFNCRCFLYCFFLLNKWIYILFDHRYVWQKLIAVKKFEPTTIFRQILMPNILFKSQSVWSTNWTELLTGTWTFCL